MRNFDTSYLKMAEVWAQNSRAIRAKVGALIVKDNMIISDGFNGTPSGFENECENIVGCKNNKDSWFPGIPCVKFVRDDFGTVKKKECKCGKELCEHAILETKPYVLHAEANAITKLAKSNNSSVGSTLYVTMSPCLECAKLIIQSGIKRVVYKDKYRNTDGLNLLEKAGIEVKQIDC